MCSMYTDPDYKCILKFLVLNCTSPKMSTPTKCVYAILIKDLISEYKSMIKHQHNN